MRGIHSEFYLIETLTTCDEPFTDTDGGWGSRVAPPPDFGWKIVDYRLDRRTTWQRVRAITFGPRRASRGGGGWVR